MSENLFKPDEILITEYSSSYVSPWIPKLLAGIKIVYLPDGHTVTCETERSPHRNREICFQMLNEYIEHKDLRL